MLQLRLAVLQVKRLTDVDEYAFDRRHRTLKMKRDRTLLAPRIH